MANAELNTFMGRVPAGTISMTVGRTIGGGIHEDIDLVNHNQFPVQFNLEIALRSDFADLFEVKSGQIVRRGLITTDWSVKRSAMTTSYDNGSFQRELTVRIVEAGCKPVYANGRISFLIDMKPGESWHACLLYEVASGRGKAKTRRVGPAPLHRPSHRRARRPTAWPYGARAWSRSRPRTRSSIASTASRSTTWPPCACRSTGPATPNSSPPPACPGSWPCSVETP